MDIEGFDQIEVDGTTVVLFTTKTGVYADSEMRLVFVGDDPEELLSRATQLRAVEMMMESVKRRNIKPKQLWALGYQPMDYPLWQDGIAPEVARRAAADLASFGDKGHVMVYALLDTARMTEAP